MATIKILRDRINTIDKAIIKKLALRNKLASKIGQLKNKSGQPITDNNREKELMSYYQQVSTECNISPIFIKKLFKIIITHSRKIQRK